MPTVKLEHYYKQQEKLNKARLRIDVLERRSWRLLYLAKVERRAFRDISKEWEAERDRYQACDCKRKTAKQVADIYFDLYHEAHGKLRGTEMMLDARSDWLMEVRKEREEAVERLLYHKKRADTLEDRLVLNQLAIGARNTRIRELLKALKSIRNNPIDVTCIYCFDNRVAIVKALGRQDEQETT